MALWRLSEDPSKENKRGKGNGQKAWLVQKPGAAYVRGIFGEHCGWTVMRWGQDSAEGR